MKQGAGNREEPIMNNFAADEETEPPQRMSAKTSRKDGEVLTEAEIEAAEEEAQAWARRANSC
jgi:hypothetical protein